MIDGAETMTPADAKISAIVRQAFKDLRDENALRRKEKAFQRLQLHKEDVERRRENQRRQEKANLQAFSDLRDENALRRIEKAEQRKRKRQQQQQLRKDRQRRVDQPAKASRQAVPVIPKTKAQALLYSQISQFHQTGSPIEGSKLLRDFCCICAGAMRVVTVRPQAVCLDCQPTGCPGRRLGNSVERGEFEYHGGQFNRGEW